jgi:predicted RNA-binding protein associated with RNAse of E/G family
MPRNGGALIDAAAATVRERNGAVCALDRLEVAGDRLYYGRPTPDIDLFSYHERWLLPDRGWVVNRFVFRRPDASDMSWYMETDRIEVNGPLWSVHDGYLDLAVYEGARYELHDAHELADGIAAAEIPLDEALNALRSLNDLCLALRRHGFSGRSLLEEYAPGLPV